MGRLCKFNGQTVSSGSLATSWDLCLKHLSRYTKMSSIAKKCHDLLQENAKRLLSKPQRQMPKPTSSAPETTRASTRRASPQNDESVFPAALDTTTGPVLPSTGQPLASQGPINEEIYLQTSVLPGESPFYSDPELDAQFFEPMYDEMGELGPSDALPWPALPYLSQLETGFLHFANS